MDIVGIKLSEALGGRGCPVCRAMEKFEEDEIEVILYEHVTDPGVRTKFRESLGLCTRHAWKTLEVALKNPLLGPLGVSIIYEDALDVYLRGKREEGECFLCELVREKEKILIEALAERLDELLPEYGSSQAILCRRHYAMLAEKIKDKPELLKKLEEVQMKKLMELDNRLKAFIDTYDYRSARKPTEEEARALEDTIEFLKGRPVVMSTGRENRRGRGWLFGLK
ncbi:DUF6062 family protein [Thermococcus waiotapuensis]|uniref:DUF6062 family protein n=1 Tax=Thermococcus waiotapuensis TaxID=90909 RepID=A0AAE4T395_9EURY|nr:DUF6062 family protein [Thermococcus waiotapuensis]MDV3103598.1 DUF6062 family protein [Thermococcus waiotapuensis]